MSRELITQDYARVALAQHLNVDPAALEASHNLEHDWGVCRLDLVLLALRLEDIEHIDVPFDELADITTVGELSRLFGRWLRTTKKGQPDIRAGQHKRCA